MVCDFILSSKVDWILSHFDSEDEKSYCYSAELASAKYAEVPKQVSYGNDISISCMKGSINPSFYASCLPSGKWKQDIFTACENNTKYPPWACDGDHVALCEYHDYGTTFVKCDGGYRPKNYTCQDINECEERTALCSGGFQCINTEGSYYCDCLAGFEKQMLSVDHGGQNITVTECLAKKCGRTLDFCSGSDDIECIYSKPSLQLTTNTTLTLLSSSLFLNIPPIVYFAAAEMICSGHELQIKSGLTADEVYCWRQDYPHLKLSPSKNWLPTLSFMEESPVNCSNELEHIVGSEWTYCKPNYERKFVNGILHNPPICFAPSCGNPSTYLNIVGLRMVHEYNWTDYYIGYTMNSFSCTDGCTLVGSESTACKDVSGVPQWMPSLPTCSCSSTNVPLTTTTSLTNSFGSSNFSVPVFQGLEGLVCDPNKCPNGECTMLYPNGTTECKCKEGTALVSGICTVQLPPTPCDPEGTANWTSTSYPDANGYCNCNPGFVGRFCNVLSCGPDGQAVYCPEPCYHILSNAGEDNPRIEGECLCLGNKGMNCSQPVFNPCDEWKCEYGTCSYNQKLESHCTCEPGYFGQHCSSTVSLCSEEIEGNTQCLNGGTCVQTSFEETTCDCVPGYTGELCESVIKNCEKENCSGHGKCWFYFNSFFCDCHSGYYGEQCEYIFDECSTLNPCQHKSICHTRSNGTALCECTVGFTGRFCETLIESCDKVTMCKNHGTCKSSYDGHPICFCDNGWYGKACDKQIKYCDFHPCFNDATCSATIDNYTCACAPGWTGPVCELPMRCNDQTDCHGHGTCDLSHATCSCYKNFNGTHCENDYTEACGTFVQCQNGGSCTDKTIKEMSGIIKYVGSCTCDDSYEGARCESSRTRDFNLQFHGRFRNTQNFASSFVAVNSEFTICGWAQISNMEDVIFLSVKDRTGNTLVDVSNSAILINSNSIPIGLDDYQWHQFCFRFSHQLFVYLDGVFSANSTHSFPTPNSDVQVVLVPYHNAQFMGSISGVQMYSDVLSDNDISEMSFNCDKYSVPHPVISWIDFPKILPSNWAVSPVFPGICYSSQRLPGRIPASGAPDKVLPIVTGCPKTIQKFSPKRLTSVVWKTEFTDNIEVTRIDANFISGDTFTWGIYEVVTTAYDAADNFASCVFNIIIAPSRCPSIKQPKNADYKKFSVDSLFASQAAKLTCHDTHYKDDNLPIFATCDIMGQWSRVQPSRTEEASLPDCGTTVSPIQSGNGSVYISGNCTDIRAKLYTALASVFIPLCSDNFTERCTFTLSNCPKPIILEQVYGFTFTFEFCVNSVRYSINSNVTTALSKFASNYTISTPNFYCSQEQPVLITTETSISCTNCRSMYGLDAKGECMPCKNNQYSSAGENECHNCPNDQTCGYQPGDKKDDCFPTCKPGQHYNFTKSTCEECGKGTFSVYGGVLQCTSCPSDQTTTHTGSTSPDDCVSCPAGTQMNEDENCEPCPIGTFSNTVQCYLCKYGLTTSHNGSTSEEACDVLNCPINTFTVAGAGPVDVDTFQLNRYCRKCELGTYTKKSNASECIKCTSPSDSPTQCNVNLCSDNSCPTGQVCTKTDLGTRCFAKEVSEKHNTSAPKWIAVAGVFIFVLWCSILIYSNMERIKIVLRWAPKQEVLVSTEYRRSAPAPTPHLVLNSSSSDTGTYIERSSTPRTSSGSQRLSTSTARTTSTESIQSNADPSSATLRSLHLVNSSTNGEDNQDKFSQDHELECFCYLRKQLLMSFHKAEK